MNKSSDLVAFEKKDAIIAEYTDAVKLVEDVTATIERMVDIHFGLRSDQLSDALIESVMIDVVKRFRTMSCLDIQHAYDRNEIIKTDWRNVTKREIIAPIEKWWNKKESIRVEFQKFIEEKEAEQEGIQKAEDFRIESLRIYKTSIGTGKFEGDIFNASAIAKEVSTHLDKKTKDKLWIDAQEKKQSIDAAKKSAMRDKRILIDEEFIGFSLVRIYSQMIVDEAVKQKISL